jgi:tetratricopeptide (TPR) repeat protein
MAMGLGKVKLSAFVTLLVVLSSSFVPNLPMVLMTSRVLAQTVDVRKAEADRLLKQGYEQYQISQFTAALQSWEQALKIYREIKDRQGEGNALGSLGIAYDSLGNYQKAIEFYQQSLAIAKQIADKAGVGRALANLGIAYRNLGDYQKAIEFHQQGLTIFKQIGDKAGESAALGNLGLAYHSLGDYQKAIEFHQQNLAIAKQIGEKDGEGIVLNNLGAVLFKSGNLAEAQRVLKQGIEVRKFQHGRQGKDEFKISIFEEQARTYRLLQQVYIAQNQPDAALEVAERGRARAFVNLLASRLNITPTEPTIDQIKQIAKAQNSTLVQYSII